jgi:hypothetical protein
MNTVNLSAYTLRYLLRKRTNFLFMFVATLFKKQCCLPFLCHESYLMLAGIYVYSEIFSTTEPSMHRVFCIHNAHVVHYKSSPQKYIFVYMYCTVYIRIFVEKRNLQEGLSPRLAT